MKRIILNQKGQVGPMSLEDIFPMVIAIIIIFVFIASIFTIVGENLSQRQSEGMHSAALGISRILAARSVFVYEGNEGLFESGKLDSYIGRNDELADLYGVGGCNISIIVWDIEDSDRKWEYRPDSIGDNSVTIALPIAIRYSVDTVNAGLLEVKVWKGG